MGEILIDTSHRHLGEFIQDARTGKIRRSPEFSVSTNRNSDTIGECLSRNLFHVLNLVLMAVVGFARAYVSILRYDVR